MKRGTLKGKYQWIPNIKPQTVKFLKRKLNGIKSFDFGLSKYFLTTTLKVW